MIGTRCNNIRDNCPLLFVRATENPCEDSKKLGNHWQNDLHALQKPAWGELGRRRQASIRLTRQWQSETSKQRVSVADLSLPI